MSQASYLMVSKQPVIFNFMILNDSKFIKSTKPWYRIKSMKEWTENRNGKKETEKCRAVLASQADVLREERVTSLRTSAWEDRADKGSFALQYAPEAVQKRY